jgi:hypothetical protein
MRAGVTVLGAKVDGVGYSAGDMRAGVTVLGAKVDGVGYSAGHARGGDSDGRTALRCSRAPSPLSP